MSDNQDELLAKAAARTVGHRLCSRL